MNALFLLLPLLAVSNAQVERAVPLAERAALDAKRSIALSRAQAAARAEALRVFPRLIVCAEPPAKSGLPRGLSFATRLDALLTLAALPEKAIAVASQFSAEKGETAPYLDDYRSIEISRDKLAYDLWSCDTQDYFFSFEPAALARDPATKEKTRPVKGRVVIQTRGSVDYAGELSCEAKY